jgi:polar amino acid transport system substrate-binding protein
VSRRTVVALVACASVLATGCASVSERAQNSSLAALRTAEPKPRTLPPPSGCEEQPFRSLAPSRLPRPGRMAPGSTMAGIHDRGYLRVGVDQNSLQLGYLNPITLKPRMQGFDIDLVREVAATIFGVPATNTRGIDKLVRYIAVSTQQRQTAIGDDEVDIVASAYSISCDRLRYMDFSSVYHRADQRLLVLKQSSFSDLAQPAARGKRICATAGSTTFIYLQRISRRTGIVPVSVPLRSDCLVKLQEGDVDAISSDDAILFGFKLQDPQTEIVGPSLECEQWGIAVNKRHHDLLRFVNAVLRRLRRSGRLREIRTHWLHDLPQAPTGANSCAARFGRGL